MASAVRLKMHGELRLKDWALFEAEQVIDWDRGMIWRAAVKMGALTVRGFDRMVDGRGEMRWKMLGIIPVMSDSGPDMTKSTAGRIAAESVWLPSVLLREEVPWHSEDPSHAYATLDIAGEKMDVRFDVDGSGSLKKVSMMRWGKLDGEEEYRLHDFGGLVEEEATFGGYTIPTRLRVGWHIGDRERFESEGEFFRCTIEDAEFR